MSQPPEAIRDRVFQIFAGNAYKPVETITPRAHLRWALGLDELDMSNVVAELEEEIDGLLFEEVPETWVTVQDVLVAIFDQLGLDLPAPRPLGGSFEFKYRYGGRRSATIAEIEAEGLVRHSVEDLFYQRYEEPDLEHTQMYITRPDDWSITLRVSGLVSIEHVELYNRFDERLLRVSAETPEARNEQLIALVEAFIADTLDWSSWATDDSEV